jgi:hypothetical protein
MMQWRESEPISQTLAEEDPHTAPVPRGNTGALQPKRRPVLVRYWYVTLPCALLVLFASPLVLHRIPNTFDTLDESFEPIQTLRFLHSKGRALHKWGPMPSFVYAPLYAPWMAYWYIHGDLGKLGTDYPYGFKHPFEQEGTLIVTARLAGLVAGVVFMLLYGRALARLTGAHVAVFLALTLCLATSPVLGYAFVATKPDGLMLAFLAGSMAVYTDILAGGLTRPRGFWLSVLAVASISCKELTLPLYLTLYAGLAVWGVARPEIEPGARRRFLNNFVATLAFGVVAYVLLNVVYAPATWRVRIAQWLAGPGKDPAIWAPPGYTLTQYLADVLSGISMNLGIGGSAIAVFALAISLAAPVKNRVLLWIPAAGFLMIVILTAGYMPPYFLSPLNVALVLPVAAALGWVQTSWYPRASRPARGVAVALGVLLCLVGVWAANSIWVRASQTSEGLVEDYCVRYLDRHELIHTANLWARQRGADRLAYLGFNIDDRALGELMEPSRRKPDVVLMNRALQTWLHEFRRRPARDALVAESGYSYQRFPELEALGYRQVAVVEPHVPRFLDFPGLRSFCAGPMSGILVYRRTDR